MSTTQTPTLEVTPRTKIGTRYAKRDRAAGLIPAVIYGHKKGAVHVTVDAKAFTEILHDESHLIDIQLDGKNEHTLVKAVQWDTFGTHVIHVDLERVDLSETIEVEVEIQLVGEPAALKEAGTVLDNPTTMVKISCRADAIPSHLEHDISELPLGEPVTVGDLTPPAGVTIVMPEEQMICQIAGVKVSAAVTEALEGGDDAGDAEPEVIGKDKEAAGDSE
ncbi:MAG: 50S ribosomal protein L25 [Phycisphaeraceae bacterium]|nr:50S ribosomal protein L25 [Phycisphaeraceae bacterium]